MESQNIHKGLGRLSSTKLILLGFCVIILIGTVLLSLPAASRSGRASITDAFFTATSATCVTGLVRFDTYTHWSLFGQVVILCLIQIGGIGFMTIALSLVSLTKRKIGLAPRVLMQESIGAPQVGGMIRMTKFILGGTALVEGLGALLLSFYFCPRVGFAKGLYFSVFHAVSAFCNAGFDLMGGEAPFSSLTLMRDQVYVNLVIMALIVIGGLGFFVWRDLVTNRFIFTRLKVHTKIVLTVSGSLILLGAGSILLLEQGGQAFAGMPAGEQALVSLFQSVSARTAGFNSVDLSRLTEGSQLILILLMMIGGSAGSTAGGMKTTTFAVLIKSIDTTFRRRKSVELFGRRMEEGIVRTATCIAMLYITLSLAAALVIAHIEGVSLMAALLESVSAIGTVGLSTGITPRIGLVSKMLLAMLMLFGRVGSITMLLAFSSERAAAASKLPMEKIQLG